MFDVNKILTAVLAGDGAGAPPPATSRDTGFLTRGRGLPPATGGQGAGAGLPFDLGSLAGRLGGLAGGSPLGGSGGGSGGLGDLLGRHAGTLGAGGLAGGLAGILLNSKHARKYAGSALKVGAAAVLGGLAYKAYQDYRAGRPVVPQGVSDMLGQMLGGAGGAAPASGPAGALAPGSEAAAARTTLLLLRAMIGAALADGRIDETERTMLIQRIEASPLTVEERQVLEGLVARPDTPASLAADAATPEERAEIYLAAYVAIDADTPAERAWLDDLAARLQLDPRLRQNLETAGDAAAAA